MWLSLVYVLGCAFRSALPMVDVPRLCLHDTPVSTIFVGRSVATAAEMAFAAQWALLLREAGAVRAARAVMPLIGAAEILSWLAVLTTNNLFHAAENSLWTLTAAVAMVFLTTRWTRVGERGKAFTAAALACGVGYLVFMVSVDVPMYLARWRQDTLSSQVYLPLGEGLRQILAPCVVERSWAVWREDALWLTLYFTVGVWISIALAHVPIEKPRAGPVLR